MKLFSFQSKKPTEGYRWSKARLPNEGILTRPASLGRLPKSKLRRWVSLGLVLFLMSFGYFFLFQSKTRTPSAEAEHGAELAAVPEGGLEQDSDPDHAPSFPKAHGFQPTNSVAQVLRTVEDFDGIDEQGMPKRPTWVLLGELQKEPLIFEAGEMVAELKKSLDALVQKKERVRIWGHNGTFSSLATTQEALNVSLVSSAKETSYGFFDNEQNLAMGLDIQGSRVRITAYSHPFEQVVLAITPSSSEVKSFQIAIFKPLLLDIHPLCKWSDQLLREKEDEHHLWLEIEPQLRSGLYSHLVFPQFPGRWRLSSVKQTSPAQVLEEEKTAEDHVSEPTLKLTSAQERDVLLKAWSEAKDATEALEQKILVSEKVLHAYEALYDPKLPFHDAGSAILGLQADEVNVRLAGLARQLQEARPRDKLVLQVEMNKLKSQQMLMDFSTFQRANLRAKSDTLPAHYAEYLRRVLLQAQAEEEEFVNPSNAPFFITLDWPNIASKFSPPVAQSKGVLETAIALNHARVVAQWTHMFEPIYLAYLEVFWDCAQPPSYAQLQQELAQLQREVVSSRLKQEKLEVELKEVVENKLDASPVFLEWISGEHAFKIGIFEKQ